MEICCLCTIQQAVCRYLVPILTNIVKMNEIVGKVPKCRTDISFCLLLVNYGIPSRIVLNKYCCLLLFFLLAVEELFPINIVLFLICHLYCNPFNSKGIKRIWDLVRSHKELLISQEERSWPQCSSDVLISQKFNIPNEDYFPQET